MNIQEKAREIAEAKSQLAELNSQIKAMESDLKADPDFVPSKFREECSDQRGSR